MTGAPHHPLCRPTHRGGSMFTEASTASTNVCEVAPASDAARGVLVHRLTRRGRASSCVLATDAADSPQPPPTMADAALVDLMTQRYLQIFDGDHAPRREKQNQRTGPLPHHQIVLKTSADRAAGLSADS